MSGPRVAIVNYTLSMMRGGGETRDLNFATNLRALGCDVTLVSVDPLIGKVRHPIQGGQSSVRNIAMPKLTGTATISAISDVLRVP